MARIDQLTGKGPISGNNVSHSNRKTRRRFLPNIIKKRFFVPELDKWITLKIAASTLRTINKLGVHEYLKRLEKQGVKTGIKL
jgi:large subunit ribosomal protein L28